MNETEVKIPIMYCNSKINDRLLCPYARIEYDGYKDERGIEHPNWVLDCDYLHETIANVGRFVEIPPKCPWRKSQN